jgi:hypothetical protein
VASLTPDLNDIMQVRSKTSSKSAIPVPPVLKDAAVFFFIMYLPHVKKGSSFVHG